jgi:hypothetical protein
MAKKFALRAAQIRPLARGYGSCVATDAITVEGQKVGCLIRHTPNNPNDSGWQFLSGKESQAYLNDAENLAIYDVNTIANYDPDIIEYLAAPIGSSFERRGRANRFVQVRGKSWKPRRSTPSRRGRWPPPGFPLVEGKHVLSPAWTIQLSELFARRVEDGSVVLWRPGLTIWLEARTSDQGQSQARRLAAFKRSASGARFAERRVVAGGLTRFDYRLRDENDDGPVEALYAFVLGDKGHLHMVVYFDDPADETTARQLVDSVVGRRRPKRSEA